jgi:hypothetical protein
MPSRLTLADYDGSTPFAGVIRVFERLGWATGVHWPVPARLAARRRNRDRLA